MYYRPISDIHLDFSRVRNRDYEDHRFVLPELSTDKETVLGIAGDLEVGCRSVDFLDEMSERFLAVVFVLGNHDYWKEDLFNFPKKFEDRIRAIGNGMPNVHLLNRSSVKIGDVTFFGGTMWTDFNKVDPITMYSGPNLMQRDFKWIRKHNREVRVVANDFLGEFIKTQDFIFKTDQTVSGKKVVLTHMAPSFKSVGDEYLGDTIDNGMYASELGDKISYSDIMLWHHGHMHNNSDYKIYNTRVINNPYGYYGLELNEHFNDRLVIEL